MTKVTFKYTVRVKNANVEFGEGLGAGVLGTQEVTFTLPEQYNATLFAMRLQEEADLMIKDIIKVDIEPLFV